MPSLHRADAIRASIGGENSAFESLLATCFVDEPVNRVDIASQTHIHTSTRAYRSRSEGNTSSDKYALRTLRCLRRAAFRTAQHIVSYYRLRVSVMSDRTENHVIHITVDPAQTVNQLCRLIEAEYAYSTTPRGSVPSAEYLTYIGTVCDEDGRQLAPSARVSDVAKSGDTLLLSNAFFLPVSRMLDMDTAKVVDELDSMPVLGTIVLQDEALYSTMLNYTALTIFREFCYASQQMHHLFMWLDIEVFAACQDTSVLTQMFKYICRTYIAEDALLRVDIPVELCDFFDQPKGKQQQHPEPLLTQNSLFEIQYFVFNCLRNVSFKTFQNTYVYEEIVRFRNANRAAYDAQSLMGKFSTYYKPNFGLMTAVLADTSIKSLLLRPLITVSTRSKPEQRETVADIHLNRMLNHYFPAAEPVVGYTSGLRITREQHQLQRLQAQRQREASAFDAEAIPEPEVAGGSINLMRRRELKLNNFFGGVPVQKSRRNAFGRQQQQQQQQQLSQGSSNEAMTATDAAVLPSVQLGGEKLDALDNDTCTGANGAQRNNERTVSVSRRPPRLPGALGFGDFRLEDGEFQIFVRQDFYASMFPPVRGKKCKMTDRESRMSSEFKSGGAGGALLRIAGRGFSNISCSAVNDNADLEDEDTAGTAAQQQKIRRDKKLHQLLGEQAGPAVAKNAGEKGTATATSGLAGQSERMSKLYEQPAGRTVFLTDAQRRVLAVKHEIVTAIQVLEKADGADQMLHAVASKVPALRDAVRQQGPSTGSLCAWLREQSIWAGSCAGDLDPARLLETHVVRELEKQVDDVLHMLSSRSSSTFSQSSPTSTQANVTIAAEADDFGLDEAAVLRSDLNQLRQSVMATLGRVEDTETAAATATAMATLDFL